MAVPQTTSFCKDPNRQEVLVWEQPFCLFCRLFGFSGIQGLGLGFSRVNEGFVVSTTFKTRTLCLSEDCIGSLVWGKSFLVFGVSGLFTATSGNILHSSSNSPKKVQV